MQIRDPFNSWSMLILNHIFSFSIISLLFNSSSCFIMYVAFYFSSSILQLKKRCYSLNVWQMRWLSLFPLFCIYLKTTSLLSIPLCRSHSPLHSLSSQIWILCRVSLHRFEGIIISPHNSPSKKCLQIYAKFTSGITVYV